MSEVFSPSPGLRGVDFSEEEREYARTNKRILLISPMVSKRCNLRCLNCYADGGTARPGELTLNEYMRIIDEAYELGAKTVRIAGTGEPFLDQGVYDPDRANPLDSEFPLIDYANRKGMYFFLFTNGTRITEEIAGKLARRKITIVTKFWGDPETQESLTGNRGWFARDKWIKHNGLLVPKGTKYLIDAGFNKKEQENGKTLSTRLAVENLMNRRTRPFLTDIYIWARENNIVPYFELIMDGGRARNGAFHLSNKEAEEIFLELLRVDEECFGYTWVPLAPYVGFACDKLFYNLVITSQGDVQPCYAINSVWLGNIRNRSLREMMNHPELEKIRNIRKYLAGKCRDCPIEACKIGGCRCDACQHGDVWGEYHGCFTWKAGGK